MENITVFAGDSHGMVVPQGQYNYVLPRTEELLDTNRVHLIRKPNNATSIQEGEDFYDQVRDYLIGSFDPEWSDHASKLEKLVLKHLHRSGHEKVAARLNLLIEFLADDDEKFSKESVFAFATFVLTTRPQYPGPGIFGDDEGHVGMQWSVPPINPSNEDDPYNGGILYLEFISSDRVSYFYDVEENDVEEGEVSLSEIMEAIEPFTRRLDW